VVPDLQEIISPALLRCIDGSNRSLRHRSDYFEGSLTWDELLLTASGTGLGYSDSPISLLETRHVPPRRLSSKNHRKVFAIEKSRYSTASELLLCAMEDTCCDWQNHE
jgi:hypothetical protein